MQHRIDLEVFLVQPAEGAFDGLKAEIPVEVQQDADRGHVLFHGHVNDENWQAVYGWFSTLPTQAESGMGVLLTDGGEPNKIEFSSKPTGARHAGTEFRESMSMFVTETEHLLHIFG